MTLKNRFKSGEQPALLALADGSLFNGIAIGASGQATGEVVFNTAMTGYQEILTDPSYAEQIVTLTYPHIGNVGVNRHDTESNHVWVKGLVIRELSLIVSNWRAEQSLTEYLIKNNIVAIAEIDTRRLTRLLRDKGAVAGCIMTGEANSELAIEIARSYSGIQGKDLASEVSTSKIYSWNDSIYKIQPSNPQKINYHVVVYDFGVKQQILRLLVENGCEVTVVPAKTPAAKVLELNPQGILLANGPGDPSACDYAIENIKLLSNSDIPLMGICLGFQLLGLAFGATTKKMKFGHHGANHPVQDLEKGTFVITSQNHGFCVNEENLPDDFLITHRSLFDGTLQGFKHKSKPIFAFQGHPEASPGPHDITGLFGDFISAIQNSKVSSEV